MTLLKKVSIFIIVTSIAVLFYLIFAIFDVEEDIYLEQKKSTTEHVAASEIP